MDEADRVEEAVDGVPPDITIQRSKPADPAEQNREAADMARSLLINGCEFYRVCADGPHLVADGWYARPEIVARYQRPPAAVASTSILDLSLEDRRTLRAIVERTHKHCFRDTPTTAMLDEVVDSLGPVVVQKMIRRAVQGG